MRITEALNEAKLQHQLNGRQDRLIIAFNSPLAQSAFMRAIEGDLGMPGGTLRRACWGGPDMYNGIEFRVTEPTAFEEPPGSCKWVPFKTSTTEGIRRVEIPIGPGPSSTAPSPPPDPARTEPDRGRPIE